MLIKILSLFLISIFFQTQANNGWYNWDVQLYDQYSKPQYRAALKSLKKFDLSQGNFKTFLEIGCATANVSNYLAKRNSDKQFIAIDLQEDFVDFARKKHDSSSNLFIIRDSAQDFDLQNLYLDKADFIMCYNVLHWIPEDQLQKVFHKIYKNLNPNGIVDIITSVKQEETGLTKAVKKTILKRKWWKYLPTFIKTIFKGQNKLTLLTIADLCEFAMKAKLNVDKWSEQEQIVEFKSQEEFSAWLNLTLAPWGINNMTKEDKKLFIKETADLYLKEYNPGQNGKVEYRYRALSLTAHRSANPILTIINNKQENPYESEDIF